MLKLTTLISSQVPHLEVGGQLITGNNTSKINKIKTKSFRKILWNCENSSFQISLFKVKNSHRVPGTCWRQLTILSVKAPWRTVKSRPAHRLWTHGYSRSVICELNLETKSSVKKYVLTLFSSAKSLGGKQSSRISLFDDPLPAVHTAVNTF